MALSKIFEQNLHIYHRNDSTSVCIISVIYQPVGTFSVVTYNAHCLNNGKNFLTDLCNDPNIFVIALQEHWLTPFDLSALNNIHPDFVGYGLSAMCDKLSSGVFMVG